MYTQVISGLTWLIPIFGAISVMGIVVWLLYLSRKEVGLGIKEVTKALYQNYQAIGKFFKEKIFTRATYFRVGVLACMLVSVWHGSHLFSTSQSSTLLGFINVSVLFAGTVDIGIWILIEGLISLRKRGYIVASVLVLGGIALLSILSFAANLTYNQHFFDASQFTNVNPAIMPYINLLQSTPPLVIILMTTVAELFIKPEEDIEGKTYKDRIKAQYSRKADKLEAKLEARKRELEIKAQYRMVKAGNVRISILGLIKIYDTSVNHATNAKPAIEASQQTKELSTNVQYDTYVQEIVNEQKQIPQPAYVEMTQSIHEQVAQYPNMQNMHMHNGAKNGHVSVNTTSVPVSTPITGPQITIDTEVLKIGTKYPVLGDWITANKTSASIADIATAIKMSVRDVKKLVKDGTLEETLKPGMVRLNSLFSYLKAQQ